MPRHVLDIFLSSTSEDLRVYRQTVSDVLSRLGQFAVRMETFGAKPNKPLDACREEVARSDALIVVVGHRYGWIPSKAEGGDGERSITWWEVQWALDASKPVYAFLIDPAAPWPGPREQDRLLAAATEAETLEIWRAVRSLQAFRRFLDNQTTRALFATADQLGTLVATSLFPWLLEHAAPLRSSTAADRAPIPLIPPAAPVQPAGVRRLHEQTYWQEQIHVLSARELIVDAAPVRLAIIAGRPRTVHPALANVSITSVALDGGTAANTPDDYTTSLSALIAASGGDGFHGVAPGTALLAISVLEEQLTASNASIASGIDRAILGGARVICLALGATAPSDIIDDAVNDAVQAGVTVVAPAGNAGGDVPHYPAALESVIAVGAVDHNGQPTAWTSYGEWVDIMAPGDDLSLPAGETGYSISKGTAWSCAIAAGVAALLLQINPQLTPAQVKQLLIETAYAPKSDKAGVRLVDAYAAARRALRAARGQNTAGETNGGGKRRRRQ